MTENHVGKLPRDPVVAGKIVEAQAEQERLKLERGLLGILFGTKENAPSSVAGLIALLSFFAVCVILIGSGDFASKKDAVAVVSGFLTLSLGFMFGRASKE